MRRANNLTGMFGVFIGALPALLAGCTERDSPADSDRLSTFGSSAVATNDLPEVVITAQRARSKTIVLSQRATGAVPPH
jgi:hypothetical protein